MSYNLVAMLSFGKELRQRRKNKGWTQEDLYKKSGVSASYISTLEREQPHSQTGAALRPEPDKVKKLAKALDWDTVEALTLAGYVPQNGESLFDAVIEDSVRLKFLEKIPPEDRAEFLDAFNVAYAIAKQRIAAKKKNK